jgi:hypothetical protein
MKQSTSTRTRSLSGRGMRAPSSLAALVAVSAAASAANAALTNYADEASWRAAAGAVTTVAAPNIPSGELYLPELGLDASIIGTPIPSFLVDPWGLPAGTNVLRAGVDGQVWSRSFVFSQPIATAFAIDWLFRPEFVQALGVDVYFGSTFVGSMSWEPASAFPGPTRFYGFTSTLPFSRVVLVGTHVSFGRAVMFTQIPAPGAMALFALAPLASTRRRR